MKLDAQFPKGWIRRGTPNDDFEIGIDTAVRHGGKASAYIKAKADEPEGFSTLMQTFRADDFRGKRLRMSGYVRTDKLGDWAGLWMRADGENTTVAFDNMEDRKIEGTTAWKK